jgi:hypothetical protein
MNKNTHIIRLLLLVLITFSAILNADDSPLRTQFDQQYKQLLNPSNKQDNSINYVQQVTSVWLTARKELLIIDANVEALKLEATVYSGKKQQQIMNDLVSLSAERERLLINAIQQFNNLQAGEQIVIPTHSTRRFVFSDQASTQHNSISISLSPEDLSKTGWD